MMPVPRKLTAGKKDICKKKTNAPIINIQTKACLGVVKSRAVCMNVSFLILVCLSVNFSAAA